MSAYRWHRHWSCGGSCRVLRPIIALLTIGLALGAIYGGFHYATDAVIGALLGAFLFMIAEPLRLRLKTARAV